MTKKHTPMDFLILAAVLLLIVGVFFKNSALARTRQDSVVFTYTMEISTLSPALTDTLKQDDTVYDTQGKASIGQIVCVESSERGIVLTLSAEGTPIDGGYRVGVYNIVPGYHSTYFTTDASWDGTVLSIQ